MATKLLYAKAVGTTPVQLKEAVSGAAYTVPAGNYLTMFGAQIANLLGASGDTATVDFYITNGTVTLYLNKGLPIGGGSAWPIIGGDYKLPVPPAWSIWAVSTVAASVDISVGADEDTP